MASRKSNPKPFDIVKGPSLRELELALTDPCPLGPRLPGTSRVLKFVILNNAGKETAIESELCMIRCTGKKKTMCALNNPTTMELGLVVTHWVVGDIFFSAHDQIYGKFCDRANEYYELNALYNHAKRSGRLTHEQLDWRELIL
jgi:hypothetical protein